MKNVQQVMKEADAQDRRRQNQIKQQMVRMDNMKLIINELAQEVHNLEDKSYLKMETGEARPVSKIINDAIIRANRD